METTPELDAFEAAYFDNDGKISLVEFIVESHNQPPFKAALAEDAIKDGEDPIKSVLVGAHNAIQMMGWHYDSHDGSDRLAVFGATSDGGIYMITRTRREWNELVLEAIGHMEAERELLRIFG